MSKKIPINQEILANLRYLPSLDQKVISLYYGLEGKPKTLREIGELYEVSAERIRQVLHRAVIRLTKVDNNNEKTSKSE
jgi:RNA polymerase primary sigma factor